MPALDPLRIEEKSDPIVPEQFHQVPASAPEGINVPRERVSAQSFLDLQRQPGHPQSHIGHARRQPDPHNVEGSGIMNAARSQSHAGGHPKRSYRIPVARRREKPGWPDGAAPYVPNALPVKTNTNHCFL